MRKAILLSVLLLTPVLVQAQGTLTVSSVYGPVEWKAVAAPQFAPLSASTQVVHVGDQIRTGAGGSAVLGLSDGSYMVVSENSVLTVQDFWTASNLKDLANVLMGKVRFYIQRMGGKPNPYRVTTSTALIAVRGTIFDVAVDESHATEVRCLEGVVSVANSNFPDREVILQENLKTLVLPGEYPVKPVPGDADLSHDRVVRVERHGAQDSNGKDIDIDTLIRNSRHDQPVDPLQAPAGVNGNGDASGRAKPALRYPQF